MKGQEENSLIRILLKSGQKFVSSVHTSQGRFAHSVDVVETNNKQSSTNLLSEQNVVQTTLQGGTAMYLIRCLTFLESLWTLYSKAKGKLLTKEEIEERFMICTTCDKFTGKSCSICGCCAGSRETYFNKLAYPTERCPDNPPKWVEKC